MFHLVYLCDSWFTCVFVPERLLFQIFFLHIPYCYYYKWVLILANIRDLVMTAKFCVRY